MNLQIQPSSILEYCCKEEIVVMGYTPFGSVFYNRALPGAPPPRVDDPLLLQIAGGHNKTVPQIILRYLVNILHKIKLLGTALCASLRYKGPVSKPGYYDGYIALRNSSAYKLLFGDSITGTITPPDFGKESYI